QRTPPAVSATALHPSRRAHGGVHSFPTRRSSDLRPPRGALGPPRTPAPFCHSIACRARPGPQLCSTTPTAFGADECGPSHHITPDRKSTRLNSSHDQISYAVFCLKKKHRWATSVT